MTGIGAVTIEEAVAIHEEYVACKLQRDYRPEFYGVLGTLKRGRLVLTKKAGEKVPTFALVRVTHTGRDMIGDPLVRVTDGVHSWRIADCVLLTS